MALISSNSGYFIPGKTDLYIGGSLSGWNSGQWDVTMASASTDIKNLDVSCGVPLPIDVPMDANISICGIAYSKKSIRDISTMVWVFSCDATNTDIPLKNIMPYNSYLFESNDTVCFSDSFKAVELIPACNTYIVVGFGAGVDLANIIRFSYTLRIEFYVAPPPFVCEGPDTASVVVAPGGGTKLFVSQGTSTHFTVRGPSQTFTWPINASDGIDIGEGPWCIYASDADGNPGGSIYDIQIGMFTENDIMSVDLSRMNDLRNVYLVEVETAATFAPFNADLENLSISGAALISVLPSFVNVDGLQSFSIYNMSVLSALPDFSTDALATFSIQSCLSLASIGTLPMINHLDIADTGITDPAVVDALVNALHPASGGIATFNGLLSLRTSASDTNYNACISAGWTII